MTSTTPINQFTRTCDKPYDRHKYKLFYENGKTKVFDEWDLMFSTWINHKPFVSHVEVIDRKKKYG